MSNPTIPTEQLLELLVQLKKTTPASARQILNDRPQIAYALISLMVSMDCIKFDVFQKILAEYGAAAAAPPPMPIAPPQLSAVPPHMQPAPHSNSRTATPPAYQASGSTYPSYPPQNPNPGWGRGPPQGYGGQPPTSYPAPSLARPGLNEALAVYPENQRVCPPFLCLLHLP
ncbi:unnamed protein product [Mycena citricolor]|uniref:Cleavage stimulation factor subunit 2 hinge domain-containing protein n=1 Tax=Mycena citricolor TaxID=2018698 RepID=A0AAD2HRZ8_9AGAR|nr:unnamed protein product [Mycena citricolor]CAK5280009.1 unnamed protein product [Mycena citricolor]